MKLSEKERAAIELEARNAGGVMVPCRRFVFPEYARVVIGNREYDLWEVFSDRLAGRVQEVFQLSPDERRYTGRFTEGGEQRLADLLGMPVTIAHQPTWESYIDLKTSKTYNPSQQI